MPAEPDVLRVDHLKDFPQRLRGCGLTIGNFDGVHRGHAHLISRLVEQARQADAPAVVFTFDPPPIQLLRPEALPPSLSTMSQRVRWLGELGAAAVVVYPTDHQLLRLTAHEFFDRIVLQHFQPRVMVEGTNFYFGRDRQGDVALLRELCQQAAISFEAVPPLQWEGKQVSSSAIRVALSEGDLQQANALLGRPYQVVGQVEAGAGRGAGIGFPTANVGGVTCLLPPVGVYAGRGFAQGKAWPAAINLGPNPTFGEDRLKLEVHLIGCQEDLYEQTLHVDFLAKIRDVQPFAGVEALKAQLARDVAQAEQIAASSQGTAS